MMLFLGTFAGKYQSSRAFSTSEDLSQVTQTLV